MTNVRDMIVAIQNEIHQNDYSPTRATEILGELSSLLGSVNDQLKIREMEYNRKLLSILDNCDSVSKAKIISQTTAEYEQLLDVKGIKESVLEMIRSMKYFIRAKAEEYKESYQ